MAYAVECMNLSRRYGGTMALDRVNLALEEDKIYGLLGRNGAGKTTLLNIVTTHSFQSEGTVRVFGEEPRENQGVLDKIAYVKEAGGYLAQLKVREIIKMAAFSYRNWDGDYAQDLLKQFNLDAKKGFSQLSKGMQSSLGIIIGLASRAPLTLFDEPYLGLDAAARWLFYDILLKDYTEHPRTIILSTHLIDEVSKLFESIILLDKGSIRLVEEVEELRSKAIYLTGRKEAVMEAIINKNIIHSEVAGNSFTAAVYDTITQEEKRSFISKGMEVKPIPLQDFFIHMTVGTGKQG